MPKTKFYKFTGSDGNEYGLSVREKAFCEDYLSFVGNGTKAVKKAGYRVKNDNSASVISTENLRKPHILQYMGLLLNKAGFDEVSIRKQHSFILNQFADLSVKAKAIDMYYRVNGMYASHKQKRQFEDEFHEYTDEELGQELVGRLSTKLGQK